VIFSVIIIKTEVLEMKEKGKAFRRFVDKHMAQKGIESYKELSNLSDVSPSEISNLFAGVRQKPSLEILERISSALGANYVDTLDIFGLFGKSKIKAKLPKDINPIDNMVVLPVVGVVRAGQPIYAEENIIGYEPINPEWVRSGEYFFLQVVGNSMMGSGINNGSIVLVRKQEYVENGEVAAVMVDEESATIKRVYYNRDIGTVTLQPDNTTFVPQTYSANNIRIVGKVVRAIIDPNRRK
jgi:repressor LexA